MVQKIKELLSLKEARQMLNELRGPTSFEPLMKVFQAFHADKRLNYTSRRDVMDNLQDILLTHPDAQGKFKILGAGSYGMTFAPINNVKGRDYVVKIWFNDPAYEFVINVIKNNQHDPHMPRVYWKPRTLFHMGRTKIQVVVLEKLIPLDGVEYRLELDILNELFWSSSMVPIENITKALISRYGAENMKMMDDPEYDDVERIQVLKYERDSIIKVIESLYPTLAKFANKKYTFDLHPGNIMKREDGTLVIIDPLFDMSIP